MSAVAKVESARSSLPKKSCSISPQGAAVRSRLLRPNVAERNTPFLVVAHIAHRHNSRGRAYEYNTHCGKELRRHRKRREANLDNDSIWRAGC